MAELTDFAYCPGTSALHRMDVRVKLACLVAVGLAAMGASPRLLAVPTLVLAAALCTLPRSLRSVGPGTRYVAFLMAAVFAARAVTTPGAPVAALGPVSVTAEGIFQGIWVCWRLALVLAAGTLLTVTTRPSAIKAAVQWGLGPVPCVPERRVGTMFSLIVRFVPVVFDQVHETAAAQRARGAERVKNPVRRLVRFSAPVIRRTFERADRLAIAMEARCYSDHRTVPPLSTTCQDRVILCLVIGLSALSVVL